MLKEVVLQTYTRWNESVLEDLSITRRDPRLLANWPTRLGWPGTLSNALCHIAELLEVLSISSETKLRRKARRFKQMLECVASREPVGVDELAVALCAVPDTQLDRLLELV